MGKKQRAWKRLDQEAWTKAWKEWYGPYVQMEQIKEGLRFCYYTGDFNLQRVWFEVVEMEYDWRYQDEVAVVWREDLESFERWPKCQICQVGHIKEVDD